MPARNENQQPCDKYVAPLDMPFRRNSTAACFSPPPREAKSDVTKVACSPRRNRWGNQRFSPYPCETDNSRRQRASTPKYPHKTREMSSPSTGRDSTWSSRPTRTPTTNEVTPMKAKRSKTAPLSRRCAKGDSPVDEHQPTIFEALGRSKTPIDRKPAQCAVSAPSSDSSPKSSPNGPPPRGRAHRATRRNSNTCKRSSTKWGCESRRATCKKRDFGVIPTKRMCMKRGRERGERYATKKPPTPPVGRGKKCDPRASVRRALTFDDDSVDEHGKQEVEKRGEHEHLAVPLEEPKERRKSSAAQRGSSVTTRKEHAGSGGDDSLGIRSNPQESEEDDKERKSRSRKLGKSNASQPTTRSGQDDSAPKKIASQPTARCGQDDSIPKKIASQPTTRGGQDDSGPKKLTTTTRPPSVPRKNDSGNSTDTQATTKGSRSRSGEKEVRDRERSVVAQKTTSTRKFLRKDNSGTASSSDSVALVPYKDPVTLAPYKEPTFSEGKKKDSAFSERKKNADDAALIEAMKRYRRRKESSLPDVRHAIKRRADPGISSSGSDDERKDKRARANVQCRGITGVTSLSAAQCKSGACAACQNLNVEQFLETANLESLLKLKVDNPDARYKLALNGRLHLRPTLAHSEKCVHYLFLKKVPMSAMTKALEVTVQELGRLLAA